MNRVEHCPSCGQPMIAVPVLQCADCREEHPLRCFTYRPRGGPFIAECIDLDLLAQGDTVEEAIGKLQEAMFSYLDVAFADESTKGLVLRPSPLSHRVRYYLHRLVPGLLRFFRLGRATHLLLPTSTSQHSVSHYFCHC